MLGSSIELSFIKKGFNITETKQKQSDGRKEFLAGKTWSSAPISLKILVMSYIRLISYLKLMFIKILQIMLQKYL